MNICGLLVHVRPEQRVPIRDALAVFAGVEVHGATDDGRLIIVVEDTTDKLAPETIMDLHQVPGVISLTLTYHHFEHAAPASPRGDIPAPGSVDKGDSRTDCVVLQGGVFNADFYTGS